MILITAQHLRDWGMIDVEWWEDFNAYGATDPYTLSTLCFPWPWTTRQARRHINAYRARYEECDAQARALPRVAP
jgi:hypothetical protein